MSASLPAAPARPLRLSELFDRAVAVYARRFSLFVRIALIVAIPVFLADWLLIFRDTSWISSLMTHSRAVTGANASSLPPQLLREIGHLYLVLFALLGLNVLLSPLAITAAA